MEARARLVRLNNDAALIERREYKYLIDGDTAAAVRAAIRPFCALDRYARQNPAHAYTVETLYLDTPDLALFWANDHEQVDRVKVRVRGYAEARSAPVFFEVKRRINDVISKSRGRVARGQWRALLEDPGAPIPESVRPLDRPHVERFLALVRTKHARPVTLVRYQREPWVSQVDDYARVTFDTRIQAADVGTATFDPPERSWRALDGAAQTRSWLKSMVVLELKFTTHVPRWMINVVRGLGLVRGAYSKYGNSIRAFYEPAEFRTARHGGRH